MKAKQAAKPTVNPPGMKWKAWVENGEALFVTGLMMEKGGCQILDEKLLRRIIREELDRPKKKR